MHSARAFRMIPCDGCGTLHDTAGVNEVLACEFCPPTPCDQCGVVAIAGECPCWVELDTPSGKWAAALLGFNVTEDGRWVR